MDHALTRLKDVALRRLWTEEPIARARRRCRTLVATPFAALAGITWGAFSAPEMASGSVLFWGLLGGIALPVLLHVEQRFAPVLFELAQRRLGPGRGGLAATVGETAIVGGFLYWVTRVLGAPVVPEMATALGVGAFYAFVMEYVVCGSAASHLVGLIQGTRWLSRPRRDGTGHADTLAMRGDHAAAITLYEEAMVRAPRDGSLYVRCANSHLATGAFERAIGVLRAGFRTADLTIDEEAFLIRRIAEIAEFRLGSLDAAAGDLEALLVRQSDTAHASWARDLLGRAAHDPVHADRAEAAPSPPGAVRSAHGATERLGSSHDR